MEKIEVGEIFTITDENDVDQELEVLAAIELEDNVYIAVAFVEDVQKVAEEDIDIYFLKVDEDGDFDSIESDDEFEEVFQAFDEILKDEE